MKLPWRFLSSAARPTWAPSSSGTRLVAALLVGLFASPAAMPGPAAGSARREGTVTTPDGVRIRYVEAGRGRTILFVPGWTMTAEIWDAQIAHFSRAWRVVALDPRAQGGSSRTFEGLHPSRRAGDIKAVIDSLRLAPVALVGWSMGVSEVAAFVGRFGTADLSAVVLVDGIAGGPMDGKTTPAMLQWIGALQRDRPAQTAAFVKSMFRTPRSADYLARVTTDALRTPTAAAVALIVGAMTEDHRAALDGLDRPSLLAVAPGGPFDAAYEEMARRIPGVQVVRFDGAGHALFVDQADRFNEVLETFLARR